MPGKDGLAVVLVSSAMLAGCNFEHGEASGDAHIDGPVDVIDSPPPGPKSCNEIHTTQPTLLSSTYEIDPDGPGGEAPFNVWCDMITDGGGWTVVFLAPNANLDSTATQYTSATKALLDDAQSALIAYRTSSSLVVGNYASFAMPSAWRMACPLSAFNSDVTTMVSVSGMPAVSATLRFGSQAFASVCGDTWLGTASIGRLCVVGTQAPFYAGFSSPSGDSCGDSLNSAGGVPCNADRQFSIAVR